MMNPRDIMSDSIMPNYPWLAEKSLDFSVIRKRLSVMKMLGVPYTDEEVADAAIKAERDAKFIAQGLAEQGAPAGLEKKEIVALIAYLQSLGQKKGARGVTLSE
jgi:cytochrome c oxidase cbb3-type subunit I/II